MRGLRTDVSTLPSISPSSLCLHPLSSICLFASGMLAQDSGQQLRGSTDVTANTMAEATSSSPATSTPCSIMSLLQERERCIASPSTGSEVIGWGKSTMKPAFGIFPSLEAAAQSPKTTHASDGLPQVSPTTSTLKILEQMVAEEEKELVLSTTSGTIVLLPDHQQKPRSLPLDVAIISPNDVRSRDADSTATTGTTGTDPAERLSPPPREWASEIRLRHFEHAQRLHRAASQANFRAARKMTELARHEESQSWPGASRVPGLQRQQSTSLPIGYFHASSDTEAQFSRWAADDFADPKHEETPLRRLLMSLHAIFGCDRALR